MLTRATQESNPYHAYYKQKVSDMRDQLEKSMVLHGSAVRDEVKAPEVMQKKATVAPHALRCNYSVPVAGGGCGGYGCQAESGPQGAASARPVCSGTPETCTHTPTITADSVSSGRSLAWKSTW